MHVFKSKAGAVMARGALRCGNTVRAAMVALGLGVALMGAAQADYPDRPIRIVVSFPPAGSADILSRAIGERLGADLGQSVIVENKPGASGAIGMSAVARAPADGYTLYVGAVSTLAVTAATMPDQQYHLVEHFEPVGGLAYAPHVLVAPMSLPASSVSELVAYVKKDPGRYNFASQGTGSLSHLESEMLLMKTGMQMVHVPYKGSAAALPEVINGISVMFFDSLSSAIGQIQGGRLKALAVPSAERSSLLPEVPTLRESGLDIEANSLFAMFAPKGTPAEAVSVLSASLEKVLAMPDLKSQLAARGIDARYAASNALGEAVKKEYSGWAEVVKAANIPLQQ